MADDKGNDDKGNEGNDAIKLVLEKMAKENADAVKALTDRFEALEKKINASSNGQTDTTPSSNDKGEEEDDDKGENELYTSKELDSLSTEEALANMDKVRKSMTAEYQRQQKGA